MLLSVPALSSQISFGQSCSGADDVYGLGRNDWRLSTTLWAGSHQGRQHGASKLLLLSRPSLAAKRSPGGSACTTQSEQATERAAITPVTCDQVHCRRRWVHDWVEKREAFGSFAYLACTCHLKATTRRHDLGLHLNHVSATDLPVFANSILLTGMVPDRYTQFPIPKAYRAKAT